ncbi:MAG: aminomethyl-transferring glycine dehydrogenase subunit GcvPB, partial [Parasphingorhabdus sp.]
MNMLAEGRPTKQEENLVMPEQNSVTTHSGNRALIVDEPLIFETGSPDRSGVDLPAAPDVASRLGGLERTAPIGLPGL